MITTLESTLVQAYTISLSFHQDILALLEDESVDKAELDTINGYLKAVALVSGMNRYRTMKEKGSTEQHCVRCHNTFTKDSNDSDSCVIPHIFDGDDYHHWGYGVRYTSECCGEGATLLEETIGNCDYEDLDRLGKCFVGRHTTSVKTAGYNNINIFPCKLEDGECDTEVIDEDDDPVFK
jgi:hypothetical protein